MMMNKLIWVFACSVALSAASVDSKSDKEVLATMDAYKEAMTHKDGAALSKLLADDLAYTHSGGQFETKANVIKSITTGETIVERIDFSDTTVRLYGKTALVQGEG